MTIIPWKVLVIPQFFNFAVFLAVLIYFVRKPIVDLIKSNAQKFAEARQKAEHAKVEVEARLREIQTKIRDFERGVASSLSTAEKEAKSVKLQLIEDAKKTAQRQVADVEAMAQYEYIRAANDLRIEVVQAATEYAGTLLKTRTDKNLKSKLNDEFIKKVKAT